MVQTTIGRPTKIINPVIAYLGFVKKTVFSNKSLFVYLTIFSLLSFLVGLIPLIISHSRLMDGTVKPHEGWSIFDAWTQSLSAFKGLEASIIVFTSGLTGISVFMIMFKDGESDGTELITVSKPISRRQILCAKYLFALIMVLIIALINEALFGISYVTLNSVTNNWLSRVFYPPSSYPYGSIYFGGIFAATILSFFVFGLMSSCIAVKASGKVTRVLVMIIMFGCIGISNLSSNLIPAYVENPVVNSLTKSADKVMDGFVGKTMSEINRETTVDYKSNKLAASTQIFGGNNGSGLNTKYEDYKNFKITGITRNRERPFRINYSMRDTIDSWYNCYSISFAGLSNKSSIAANEVLYKGGYGLNQLVLKNMGNSTPASWAVVMSYINPMNSMQNMISSALPPTSTTPIPYNWSLSNFVALVPQGNKAASPITFRDVELGNPIWALLIVWIGVSCIFGAFTTIGYLRKDFI